MGFPYMHGFTGVCGLNIKVIVIAEFIACTRRAQERVVGVRACSSVKFELVGIYHQY